MRTKQLKLILSFVLVMIASCDEPETVVTDIIHTDGSVTREIEMKNIKNNFKISDIQVPFDSTWAVRDSLEFSEKGDTVWVKRARKFFNNTDEINLAYKADSGANNKISRKTEFRKNFRWFNTEYRFAEKIDKKLAYGYPASDFLNSDEMAWFYSPENIINEKKNGPDSLKFRAFDDSVKVKTGRWGFRCLVSEWIGEFSRLAGNRAGNEMSFNALKEREPEFARIVEANGEKTDSLWKNGILLAEFIGKENAVKFKTEADSALNIVTNNFFFSFSEYTQRIIMPGKVIGTDGFIDSSGILLWPVKSDYFLAQNYEMWAESKMPNTWAWILSGVFLVFVLTGIIFRKIKKGQ